MHGRAPPARPAPPPLPSPQHVVRATLSSAPVLSSLNPETFPGSATHPASPPSAEVPRAQAAVAAPIYPPPSLLPFRLAAVRPDGCRTTQEPATLLSQSPPKNKNPLPGWKYSPGRLQRCSTARLPQHPPHAGLQPVADASRSEEHMSELQ